MVLHENAIDLSEAAKLIPTRPHISTLWRWCRKGVNGVRLEYTRAGRRILTTPDALEAFCRALADADRERDAVRTPTPSATPRHRTSKQRERDIERAEATLAKAGI